MQNIGWDLAKRSLPSLGAAIVFVVGNSLVQMLEADYQAALVWLSPLILLLPLIIISYRISLLPGRVRWSLPEAVAFLAFGVPIKKSDWTLFNLIKYNRGEVKITKHIYNDGTQHHSGTAKSIVKESERKEFLEKTKHALELIFTLARRGELTITGRPIGEMIIVEIPANFFVENVDVDFVSNELKFSSQTDTDTLPSFRQVMFYRDEILAIKGVVKPLNPPIELTREELNEMWSERYEVEEDTSVHVGIAESIETAPPVSATKLNKNNSEEN
jgi:hypothetical protein